MKKCPRSLSDRYTQAELLEMARKIEADPANHNPPGSLWRYTAAARRKLDKIHWAIAEQMVERAGTQVGGKAGYTGRQTNRR